MIGYQLYAGAYVYQLAPPLGACITTAVLLTLSLHCCIQTHHTSECTGKAAQDANKLFS
jgi:hypothetical protein